MKNLTPAMLYAFSDAIEQIKAINEIVWADRSTDTHDIDLYFVNHENQNKLIDTLTLGHRKMLNEYVEQHSKGSTPLGDLCSDLLLDSQYINAPNAIYVLAYLVSLMDKKHLVEPIEQIISDVYASKLNEYFNS